MPENRRLTTEEKALKINLRQDIYGSFAEIGAGQEVAANFFKAGGSSGTIAYTHSAYDMKVSDSLYVLRKVDNKQLFDRLLFQ